MENTLGTRLMHREDSDQASPDFVSLEQKTARWEGKKKKRKLEDVGDNSKHSKQQKLDRSGNFEPLIHKLLTEDQICCEPAQRARRDLSAATKADFHFAECDIIQQRCFFINSDSFVNPVLSVMCYFVLRFMSVISVET